MKQLHKALTLITMLCATGIASPASGQTEIYDPEARLAELGIELPEPPSPVSSTTRRPSRARKTAGS